MSGNRSNHWRRSRSGRPSGSSDGSGRSWPVLVESHSWSLVSAPDSAMARPINIIAEVYIAVNGSDTGNGSPCTVTRGTINATALAARRSVSD